MQKEEPPDLIDLKFSMESSGTLWNVIFEGFDQEVVLVSKFTGHDSRSVRALYRFGFLVCERYKDCKVQPKESGIEIRKSLPENDFELVDEWTRLMESVRDEITSLVPSV